MARSRSENGVRSEHQGDGAGGGRGGKEGGEEREIWEGLQKEGDMEGREGAGYNVLGERRV